MGAINFFNAVNLLEPHCPGCDAKVDYGITTRYSDKTQCHICLSCGHNL